MRPIYETWTPGTFKRWSTDWSVDPSNPQVLGAAWAVWNDNSFMTDPGLCGRDLLPMIQKNCAVFAHRTWATTNPLTFDAFMAEVANHAKLLGTAKPAAWEQSYTVTIASEPQTLAQTDEIALYAVSPIDGRVGFWREGAYYSFDVALEVGKTYTLTFASKDRNASVRISPSDDTAATKEYTQPKRQYYPEACRYTTLPPVK
jgi:hypothetical protein